MPLLKMAVLKIKHLCSDSPGVQRYRGGRSTLTAQDVNTLLCECQSEPGVHIDSQSIEDSCQAEGSMVALLALTGSCNRSPLLVSCWPAAVFVPVCGCAPASGSRGGTTAV